MIAETKEIKCFFFPATTLVVNFSSKINSQLAKKYIYCPILCQCKQDPGLDKKLEGKLYPHQLVAAAAAAAAAAAV